MANSRKPQHAEVNASVLQSLHRHVRAGSRVCVGLSGGLDSVVLLSSLHALRHQAGIRLSAVHVNHQLHPEALQWERFCQEYCDRLEVACVVERVSLRPGDGVEAAARAARYEVFARQAADVIALAHHQEDQAETVLIQLLRGAGVYGLSAMPEMRDSVLSGQDFRLWRPFLQLPRAVLRDYAAVQGLSWVEDVSNGDTRYVRNFLRHEVAPLLAQRFPAWATTLGRSARHLGEAATLLDQLAEMDFPSCNASPGLRVQAVLGLGMPRAVNLLRWWLRSRQAPALSQKRMENWMRQAQAMPDRNPQLSWGGWTMTRFEGCWHVHPEVRADWQEQRFEAWPQSVVLAIPGAGQLCQQVTQGAGLSATLLEQGNVVLRRRCGGERLKPHEAGSTRSLRNLLQEARLPLWWREALPLVFCNDRLVCVPGVAVDVAAQAQPGQTGVALHWDPFASDGAHH